MKCPKYKKDDLQDMYIRQPLERSKGKNRTFKAVGSVCPNLDCDFCVKSWVFKNE